MNKRFGEKLLNVLELDLFFQGAAIFLYFLSPVLYVPARIHLAASSRFLFEDLAARVFVKKHTKKSEKKNKNEINLK